MKVKTAIRPVVFGASALAVAYAALVAPAGDPATQATPPFATASLPADAQAAGEPVPEITAATTPVAPDPASEPAMAPDRMDVGNAPKHGPWDGLSSDLADGNEPAAVPSAIPEDEQASPETTLAFAPLPPLATPGTPKEAPSARPPEFSFSMPALPPTLDGPPLSAEQAELRLGLAALAGGRLDAALALRDTIPSGAFERKLLNWAIANGGADPGEDLAELDGWPGIDNPRRQRERTLLRSESAPQAVLDFFRETPPVSHYGARALAAAHRALGDTAKARLALVDIWRRAVLDADVEAAIIKDFGDLLTAEDHRMRMDRMLHAERVGSAMRVAELANSKPLAEAWAAALRGNRKTIELLDKVPAAQRGAGYHFAKARYLRRTKKYEEAAAAMLAAPRDAAAYADPDAWWEERRVLSRELLDLGDAATAYKLAAAHTAESPEAAADAEFHAGWYALRFVGDPAKALPHFSRIVDIAQGASSRSRGYYWMARAMKAGAPGDAAATFARAAAFGTSFYGQLAAVELGRDTIDVTRPEPAENDLRRFESRDMVRAARTLETIGQSRLSDTMVRALSRSITSPGEMSLLVDLAASRDLPLALRVGKAAAARGLAVGGLAHPTGAIPVSADISSAGKALAYAVARQESEFNVAAVSRAGARGLLQLLPATARDMARKAGLPFAPERLTTDAGYNATLGAAFLSEQLDRFSGSYILTFAGYNAGPKRARDWITRYGDPRGKSIEEAVDWVERIPFTETRHYVQRVMENYQVYKMRLGGRFDLAGDLVDGRQMAQR